MKVGFLGMGVMGLPMAKTWRTSAWRNSLPQAAPL